MNSKDHGKNVTSCTTRKYRQSVTCPLREVENQDSDLGHLREKREVRIELDTSK